MLLEESGRLLEEAFRRDGEEFGRIDRAVVVEDRLAVGAVVLLELLEVVPEQARPGG